MRIVTKVRMKRRMLLTVFSLGILMIAIVGISLATKNLIFADECDYYSEYGIHYYGNDGDATYVDPDTHRWSCEYCSDYYDEGHSWTEKEPGQYYCDACATYCNHQDFVYQFLEEGLHTVNCKYCGKVINEGTGCRDEDGDDYCDECGHPMSGQQQNPVEPDECPDSPSGQHVWSDVLYGDEDEHWIQCTICGAVKEDTVAAHSYEWWADDDENGEHWQQCDCGKELEGSRGGHNYSWSYNETEHWKVCSDCGKSTSPAPHTDDNPADNECDICGAQIPGQGGCVHDWSGWLPDGYSEHYRECSLCHTRETGGHAWLDGVCQTCDFQCDHPENNNEYSSLDDTYHSITCGYCGADRGMETHTDELDHNNICDKCGHSMNSQPGGCPNGQHTWGEYTTTTPATCTTNGVETRECTVCHTTETRTITAPGHTWSGYTTTTPATCTTNGVETRECTACHATETRTISAPGHTWGGYTTTTPATCTTNGVETRECTVCHTTDTRTIPATGVHIDNGWEYYDPTYDGRLCQWCRTVIQLTPHNQDRIEILPATCTSNGWIERYCTRCGTRMSHQDVPALGHDYRMYSDEQGHWRGCSRCTYAETKTAHIGGTHANGGKCTVCEQVYQPHTMGTTPVRYEKTATQHTPIYACTYSGCSEETRGTTVNHIDNNNDNVCDVCGYDSNVAHTTHTPETGYRKNGTEHWKICSVCGVEIEGTREAHTGGTHANGGECTKCHYTYQNHGNSYTVIGYKDITNEKHTPIYSCTHEGCTATYDGEAEDHRFTNGDGVCSDCGYIKSSAHSHTAGTTYEHNGTEHWQMCTECGDEIENTREAHFGGTHENGGKCTRCGYTYQTHSQSNVVKRYKDITSTKHTPVYKCSYTGCTGEFVGTTENHVDENNDGICDLCNWEIGREHTTHTPKTGWETDGTYHWHICSECGEEIAGSKAEHTGGTHANDGTCTICNKKYQTHTWESTPSSYKQNTEAGHIPVYKCTCEGCTETKEGTPVAHTDADGDRQCDICGYKKSTTGECEHKNTEWVYDGDYHWLKCKDCGKALTDKEKHADSNGDNKCDKCSKAIKESGNTGGSTTGGSTTNDSQNTTDSTKTTKDIPNTGITAVTIISIALGGLTAAGFIGLKKYKGV